MNAKPHNRHTRKTPWAVLIALWLCAVIGAVGALVTGLTGLYAVTAGSMAIFIFLALPELSAPDNARQALPARRASVRQPFASPSPAEDDEDYLLDQWWMSPDRNDPLSMWYDPD